MKALLLSALLGSLAIGAVGCRSNPYCLNCKDFGNGVVPPADMVPEPDLFGMGDGGGGIGPDMAHTGGACTPTGSEKCDGIDNDCNGTIDDVDPGTLVGNPQHCGACGNACSFANAFGDCVGGFDGGGTPTCRVSGCAPNHYDIDGNPANGCEYSCTPTTPATEVCDGADNNCDGQVDEGFTTTWIDALHRQPRYDKGTTNCGNCGVVCGAGLGPGTVTACQANATNADKFECVVTGCFNGNDGSGVHQTYRHNPAAGPIATTGCEYHCPKAATETGKDCNPDGACTFPPEVCDGLDDNCNFRSEIDGQTPAEPITDPGIGMRCADGASGKLCSDMNNTCVGVCAAGTLQCTNGALQCIGSKGPDAGGEKCDGVDNDCDGKVDNGFTATWADAGNQTPRYDSMKENCGACGSACGLPNAVNGCNLKSGEAKGSCYVVSCNANWFYVTHRDSSGTNPTCNVNITQPRDSSVAGGAGIGCNYNCTVNPQAPEVCDGKDNDCEGCIDNGLTAPQVCSNLGVCGTANPKPTTKCSGAAGFKCDYSGVPNVSVDANGNLTGTEPQCDGLDNNCNGPCDENFPDVLVAGGTCNNPHAAKSCTAGNGACQATGPITCQKSTPSAPFNDTQACSVVADNTKATNELCNGKDDNCNGLIDEPTTAVVGGTTFQGWHDPAVQVAVPLDPFTNQAAHTVFVYQYEASRPDATAIAAGSQSTRACSNSGTLPWSNVTYPQAQAACGAIKNAAGNAIGRLCTAWEWQQTCAALSSSGNHFSMSLTPTTYTAGVCNDGAQTQQRCASGTQCQSGTCNGSGQCTCSGNAQCSPGFICTSNVCVGNGAWPTASNGAASGGGNVCYTSINSSRAYDMSGNLQEWTGTPVIVKQGTAATTAAGPSGGTITVGGLTSIFATDVGAQLILSGAANPANNGTFDIVSFVSSTSVVIRNPAGVAGGSGITWKFIYQKLRGGAFSTQQSGGLTCEFDFDIQKASFANTDLGFRCCSDSAF